jgi:hypothetical protein
MAARWAGAIALEVTVPTTGPNKRHHIEVRYAAKKNKLFQISPQKTLLNLKQFCFRGKTHVSDWHMAVIYCRTRKRECRIYSAFL